MVREGDAADVGGVDKEATEGQATSLTLSAISSNCSPFIVALSVIVQNLDTKHKS